ncbi:MAG TPA: substrate-binding domain-containing protein [Thermomicrobiales bacterium]|nr:substrate-binding domain-containing protein [Thermomicrobiales bacterium]
MNKMINTLSRRGRIAVAVTAIGAAALMLSGCGANQTGSNNGTSSGSGGSNGATKGTIGVILPSTADSARWESFDRPLLASALKADGYASNIQNAQGDAQSFSSIADQMIASKVKALIITSPNPAVGASVELKAKAAGIPTIDYDRVNPGGAAGYYVSFDPVEVGRLQGQAVADALKDKHGASVIQIEGDPTDINAVAFDKGAREALDPLYKSGALTLVQDKFVLGWDNQLAGTDFEQVLTGNHGKVDGVVVANDGMAQAVITVLQKNGLNGKVAVTGQDATLAALQSILRGDQTMTVFKEIKRQADAAAELAADAAAGDTAKANKFASATIKDPKTGRVIKAVLLGSTNVNKSNVKEVVDKGYVTAKQLCSADLAKACAAAGIK